MKGTINYIKESLNKYYPESEISGFIRIIAEHVCKKSYTVCLLEEIELSEEQRLFIVSVIDRLKAYEPIQYILGETEFFGLPFIVSKGVLIPRPETEELIELILNENQQPQLNILDIGTGSGAIAIALARYMKNAEITAWDISDDAITIATENAKLNKVEVLFEKVDVLQENETDKKFDIIVSNPPYIPELEKVQMEQNVLDYEPHIALFVPDDNPFLFYERIADLSLKMLNSGGKLYFEINRSKGHEVVCMLREKGFKDIFLLQDLSKNDRMVRACLS